MQLNYYVINLDGSEARWNLIAAKARAAGVQLERIAAVDGRAVRREDWQGFDAAKFRINHGYDPLPGEYGCHASHLKAMQALVASGHDSAVILEDDAEVNQDLAPFATWLDSHHKGQAVMVRLSSHRKALFETLETGPGGVGIGQCWFGPTGSSAAYWLTREAAQTFLQSVQSGYLPFDVTIERPWETGVGAFLTKPDVLARPAPESSDIVATMAGGHKRPAWHGRIGALRFRTGFLLRRLIWCLATRRVGG